MYIKVNGSKLRKYRNQMNLSIADMAKQLGITRQQLSLVELEKSGIDEKLYKKIVQLLNNFQQKGSNFIIKRIKPISYDELKIAEYKYSLKELGKKHLTKK